MELVIIGTSEFLLGFALAGARKAVLANNDTVYQKVLEHEDAGLIILDENLVKSLSIVQRDAIEVSVKPVIITLSASSDKHARLRHSIMTTLGVDLLK